MTGPNHTATERALAIADFCTSGDTIAQVAARHGVARSTLGNWTAGLRDELGLVGGRWVNVRGVMRWEEFVPLDKRDLSERERRIEWEDAMFDDDEARDAHARYAGGGREPKTVIGERVYQRRKKRGQVARRSAA